MKLYDLKDLNANLSTSKKIYCSDNLTFGLQLRSPDIALQKLYIQANNQTAIKLLVIDLDHNNPLIWEDVGLPAPNWIVRDKNKNTSHLIYVLENFITKDYEKFGKNLAYFAKIQQAYTKLLNGDPNYVGLIMKNPNHQHWAATNTNPFYFYTLNELADYVDLPTKIIKKNAIGEGRNCYLFDTVRKWAYREVLFYKANQATQQDFFNVILNRLDKLNCFANAPALEFNELKAIAKSISKWVWVHFNATAFSQIQSARGKKSGHKRANDRTNFINTFSK